MILVDGGSVDGTVATARRVLPGIVTVLQSRRGKGNALACGFAPVTGDIVVMLDADGSTDPAEIPPLRRRARQAAPTSPRARASPTAAAPPTSPAPPLGNRALNALVNVLFGTRYTDLCYGYNAFWADLLPVARPARPRAPGRSRPGCCGVTASRSRP